MSLRIAVIHAVRWTINLGAVGGALLVPPTAGNLLLLAGSYTLGMLFITVGYHRYFSHRAFKTSRAVQLVLALGCCTTLQRGPLWWAAVHRHHHRHADTDEDLHSPRGGLRWAHTGWLTAPAALDVSRAPVRALARYPELRALETLYVLPALAFAAALWAWGGAAAVVWGFVIRTALTWQATYTINSLAHRIGRRRYRTRDDSRNSLVLALITMGEGWHNNHHRYPAAARNGFFPGEIDVSWWVISLLARLGLVWDVIAVPPRVLEEGRQPHQAEAEAG